MCNTCKVYAYTSQLGGRQGRIGEGKNRRMAKMEGSAVGSKADDDR